MPAANNVVFVVQTGWWCYSKRKRNYYKTTAKSALRLMTHR
jgi:hypothetical protein